MNIKNFSNINLYYVGGVVRDEILGLNSIDTDLCYVGNAIEFANNNIPKNNIIKINHDFGTVRLRFDDKEFDIASTRTEYYPRKGHLPRIKEIGCSLENDLIRRDFTINAIAKNTCNGTIVDPYRGISDIKENLLRVFHNESFIDDPTRIIRGLKFAVRFGFKLEKNTQKLQDTYLKNVNYDMSYHRLKKELIEAFSINRAEVLEKFFTNRMYKLLSNNEPKWHINSQKAENLAKEINSPFIWLIYLSFFDLSNLPLTKQEKRILECAERLSYDKPNNNTPIESILISELR